MSKRSLKLLALCMLLVPGASSLHAEIRMQLIPEEPRQNEPVHVRITSEQGDSLDSSSFDYSKSYVFDHGDGVLTIDPTSVTSTPPGGQPIDYTYYLGRFPPGGYRVAVGSGNPAFDNHAELGFEVWGGNRGRFDGEEANNPLDHTGIWWNPEEPGTSIVLNMSPHSRDLGGGFYAYDDDGHPIWYALAPGEWLQSDLNHYRVKVLRSRGSALGQPYEPDAFDNEEVGGIDLHFIDIDTLQADYEIEGVARSATLQRFEF